MYVRTFVLALVTLGTFGCHPEAAPAEVSTTATYERAVLAMELPSLERQLRESAPAPASWAMNR